MGKLTVGALRAVLLAVLTGTVLVQALMVWALASGSDPASGAGSLPLATLRELGFGDEVAGFFHRYRQAYPGPAADVLAAFGFSSHDSGTGAGQGEGILRSGTR